MIANDDTHVKHAIQNKELFSMILGEKGGRTRRMILDELLLHPCNANQLAKKLKLDYKTILYHMDIICKHQYATREKFEKYTYYHPSDKLIKNIDEYIQIKEHIKNL